MRSPSPAFSFYPKDWLSDARVLAMTYEEQGVYVRLLCHSWLEDGLPTEIEKLARLVGMTPRRFSEIWKNLEKSFTERDGRFVQKRLEQVREKQNRFREVQANKGKKGGRPKAGGFPTESPGFSEGNPKKSLSVPFPLDQQQQETQTGTEKPKPQPVEASGIDRAAYLREGTELLAALVRMRREPADEILKRFSMCPGRNGNPSYYLVKLDDARDRHLMKTVIDMRDEHRRLVMASRSSQSEDPAKFFETHGPDGRKLA